MTPKTGWLVAGVVLLVLGVVMTFTAARPDDGLDHGGNPCSPALFESLGVGSKDTNSSAGADGEPSAPKGTIAYCQEAARERLVIAGAILAGGAAALVFRRRVRSAPGVDADVAVPYLPT